MNLEIQGQGACLWSTSYLPKSPGPGRALRKHPQAEGKRDGNIRREFKVCMAMHVCGTREEVSHNVWQKKAED